MTILATYLSGFLFGAGLIYSGLINPQKVLNFLDLTGSFDPSLAVTMAVAVAVTGIGYRLVFARGKPVLGATFDVPVSRTIDARLASGAAIFGVGWGIAGFCPGPAVAASSTGAPQALIFTAAMIAGMLVVRFLSSRGAAPAAASGPTNS